MKLIRECRMGAPKCFKTGAVVGSYPKPMLYLGFDRGGIDVIPSKTIALAATDFQPDVRYEEITHIKPGVMATWVAKPESEQPKILAVDYTNASTMDLSVDMVPAKAMKPLQDFVSDYNVVSQHIGKGKALPWKTVVLDSLTGYEDVILSYISSFNPSAMVDARQWPCHVVVLMHSALDQNELTQAIRETPSVFSKGLRNDIAGLFSQFFYATKANGKPVIWVNDKMYVSGIGGRWPLGLPPELPPDFKSIYGKELV
jgi:hypothetical protein